MEYKLEVIAFNIESCVIAQLNGADRIELCDNPNEGGTTPSYGMIKSARAEADIQLFPIIRPRGGDFLYSTKEFDIMKYDIENCKDMGCDGVVIGLLKSDGIIDIERTKELVKLAYPMDVTFHRAFDRCNDPFEALEMVIDCGCMRILTSGTRVDVERGKEILIQLNEKASNQIIIMPGSGLRSTNLENIARETGCHEFHSSARINKKSEMIFTNKNMQETLDHVILDKNEVIKMKNILKQLNESNK